MKTRQWIAAVTIVVVTVFGVWWSGLLFGRDARIVEIEQLQLAAQELPEEQRREMFGQIREKMEALPEEARRDIWRSMGQRRERDMEQRLDEFFAMTPAQQRQELDKRIMEDEKRNRERQQRQAANGNRGGGGPPQGRGSGGGANPEDRRNARRDRMLDNSSPEMRAKRSEYRRLMTARRKQLGLPPGRGWGGRG